MTEWHDKLAKIISHLESTDEDDWCINIVRSKDQKKNCIMGHIFNMGTNDKEGNDWWEFFEHEVATTYMVYPVNDGRNKKYSQATPKLRSVAYCKAILSGNEKNVLQYLDRDGSKR